MLSRLRRHLAWKLFLSYLIVIVVGVIVLATAAELSVPSAFDRHLAAMGAMMGSGQGMTLDLLTGFRAALNESLAVAALAATVVALLVSLLISRQVVAPVHDLRRASQRIAGGNYDERVNVPGDPARGDLDELGELALNFNQMAARLEQVEDIRRRLIGDVAHELRTPLTTIKGTMEALIDDVLPGVEPPEDVLAESLGLDAGDEVLDDLEVDVGLEQREPNLAHRLVDIFFVQPLGAAEVTQGRLEPVGEGVEHGREVYGRPPAALSLRRERCVGQAGRQRNAADPVDHVQVRREQVVQRLDPVGERVFHPLRPECVLESVLDEALYGLRCLPDFTDIDASDGLGGDVEDHTRRWIRVKLEANHHPVITIDAQLGYPHEQGYGHATPPS